MATPLQLPGIARIRGARGRNVAGTAFLVSNRHAMTCAHVVNRALDANWDAAARPDSAVHIEFPFAANGPEERAAQVVEWRPPGDGEATDVAVLELADAVDVPSFQTAPVSPPLGHPFRTTGFPAGYDNGMPARGTLEDEIGYHRRTARGDGLHGFFIKGGFSGAPIVDINTGLVLGMAAAVASEEGERTAFIIPVEQLERAWPTLAQPYKALSAFQEADARFFAGRERHVRDLQARLEERPFVAVVGRSGSGKSSLVRAGLLPRLRAKDGTCRVVVFSPGSPTKDPFQNLASALLWEERGPASGATERHMLQKAAEDLAGELRSDAGHIVQYLRSLPGVPGTRGPPKTLLVADQFEDLVTPAYGVSEADRDGKLRAGFVQCLRAATDDSKGEPAARCVITVREDHLNRAFLRDNEWLQGCQVTLGPMMREELRAVITEPAGKLEVTFDEGLVETIIRSFQAQGPGGLPLLEFALTELWAGLRHGDRLLTAGAGGDENALTGALERHAERIYEKLAPLYNPTTFRKVMCDLVRFSAADAADEQSMQGGRDPKDTKRPRWRSDFDDREWELIGVLASQDRGARLVSIGWSRTTNEPTAEIVHDALTACWKRLRGWLEADRPFRLWLQRTEAAAEEWRQEKKASSYLLTGRRLRSAEDWKAKRPDELKSVEEFISASRIAEAGRKIQSRAAAYTGTIEKATAGLFDLSAKLEALCKGIKKDFGFDFVTVQWRDREAKTIQTVYGVGLDSSWYGISKHSYVGPRELWDIQAHIVESDPPRIEVLWGEDPRFDKFIFDKFGHRDKRRVFAPILVATSQAPLPAPADWATTYEQLSESGVQGRIVLELRDARPGTAGGPPHAVMGTVEAGYNDLSRQIPPETAKALVAYAARPALRLRRSTMEYVFKTIAACTKRIVDADVASVHYPFDPNDGHYLFETRVGRTAESPSGLSGAALRRRAVQGGKTVHEDGDSERHPSSSVGGDTERGEPQRLRAAAAIPIVFTEDPRASWAGGAEAESDPHAARRRMPDKKGVLYAGFNKPHEFTEAEIKTLEVFAGSAAQAVRRATSYMYTQEDRRRQIILQSVMQALANDPLAPNLLDDIAGNALNMFAADVVTIHEYSEGERAFSAFGAAGRFIDNEGARRRLKAVSIPPAPKLVIDNGRNLYESEVRVGSPMYPEEKEEATGIPRFVKREQLVSCASVILRAGNEVVGVMFINYRSPHHFPQEERRFVETLALSAATAIRNRRLLKGPPNGGSAFVPPGGGGRAKRSADDQPRSAKSRARKPDDELRSSKPRPRKRNPEA